MNYWNSRNEIFNADYDLHYQFWTLFTTKSIELSLTTSQWAIRYMLSVCKVTGNFKFMKY